MCSNGSEFEFNFNHMNTNQTNETQLDQINDDFGSNEDQKPDISELLIPQNLTNDSTPIVENSCQVLVIPKIEFEAHTPEPSSTSSTSTPTSSTRTLRSHTRRSMQENREQALRETNRIEENQKNGSNDMSDNNWLNWVDIREVEGNQRLFCKWFDCRFETPLRIAAKNHINKHLLPKCTTNSDKAQGDYQNWDQILPNLPMTSNQIALNFYVKSEPMDPMEEMDECAPKRRSKKSTIKAKNKSIERQPKPEVKIENDSNESKVSQLIDLNINRNNVVLSLKGMASYKKLHDYIDLRVVDGTKYYFCAYPGATACDFKCRRTQQLAIHIHTAHIGFYLKCIQPNCDKVFRSPNSWREHQKNHICNFGIYGYGRGVIGVCRMENITKYRERIILANNEKGFRCKWTGCQFFTRNPTCIKRHIHNQHVCPYRNNNEWKKSFNKSITNKNPNMSDIPLNAMISRNERQVLYFCRRTECSAHFANEAELRKHENLLCKFRIKTKGVRNGYFNEKTKQKSVPKVEPKVNNKWKRNEDLAKTAKSKRIEENIRKIKEQKVIEMEVNSGLDLNLNRYEREVNDLIELQVFEGVNYYLCKYFDCKYVSKFIDKINEHILGKHFGSTDSTSNYELMGQTSREIGERVGQKRKHFSQEFIDNTQEIQDSKRMKSYATNSCVESSSQLNPMESIDKYIANKSIDGEPNYFCQYLDCKYYTNDFKQIRSHIQSTHVVYKCLDQTCGREFKSNNLLDVHKRNHICGFGIRGRKPTGVCDLDNIRKYRGEMLIEGMYVYPCKWLDCRFVAQNKNNALSHIHSRHICPNRAPTYVIQNI